MEHSLLDAFYGNQHAKDTLVLGLQGGRISHAILLEGEGGCGKKTFARIIAQAAVCTGEQRPCGTCRHCIKAAQGAHPDIVLIDGAEAAKNLNIAAIRELRADASIKPNEAQCKVYILADAQNMTPQAQNALLKVLEEPPRGVMFLLTCENRSLLLQTILSRTTLLRIENPTTAECATALRTLVPDRTDEECQLAADVFGGNIGRAVAGFRDESFIKIVEAAQKVVEAAVRGAEYNLLAELAVFENDRTGFQVCLRRVKIIFAQLLRQKYSANSPTTAQRALDNYISALQCTQIVDIIEKALRLLEQNMGYALASAWLCSQIKACMRS